MKKILLTLLSVLFCAITFAQSVPQGINYQAVARDASGAVLMNQNLTIQFSVISDITTSAVSWQETHLVTTNGYGLYTAIIGQGTTTNGGSSLTFDVIDWGASNHLFKVEVDFGSGYLDMGTTAFMSVPYAINSTPQSLTISGDTLFISSGNYIILPSSAPTLLGCTDSTAINYNPLANTDDGSCIVIGDTYGGGIIFWLDGNGGGLIAAPSDQSTSAEWGCYGTLGGGPSTYTGASGIAIGTGAQNTAINVNANCSPYISGNLIAANICDTLILGGYSDWFLPSKDELNEMYLNIGNGSTFGNVGGFASLFYWSSTEGGNLMAYGQDLDNGIQILTNKNIIGYVRAVRAFGNVTIITGCTDPTATNYNAAANTDDGSCIAVVNGCTDSTAFNYNALANTDDGSCIAVVNGCTDSTATNYNAAANTDDGSCLMPFTGAIGDTYGGGIVFWLDGNGGGLISAPSDQSSGTQWGCVGTLIGTNSGMGAGSQNTIDIELGCNTPATAADICANLTLGGYSDWFLPSKDELNEMYLNIGQGNALGLGNIGGFANDSSYWSSTEDFDLVAWVQSFGNGAPNNQQHKDLMYPVRAIRAFGNMTLYGCTDLTAFNYNQLANTDDGSCIINGCTDSTATNYNAAANTDDASCIAVVNGCTDSTATNYNPLANTDDGSCCFNGNVCIGSTYQGGIIFYLDGNGGGLISTPTDLTAEWGCFGFSISGADGTAIGTGNQNTIDILNGCTTPNTAADICDTLTLGGYSDWFLPSIDELNEMYLNIGQGNALGLGNLGGFLNWGYWSSSEYNNDNGWGCYFVTGGQGLYNKGAANKFRAIRAF